MNYRIATYLRERFLKALVFKRLFELLLKRELTLKGSLSVPYFKPPPHQPLVSVVIATKDNEKTIKRSIDSLLNQSHKNLEIVIVNDGSSDSTSSILTTAEKTYRNIRVINHPSPIGTSLARNAGIEICTANFITFQDGDDYSHKHRIKKQLRPLLKNKGIHMSLCSYVRIDQHNKILCINGRHVRRCIISMLSRSETLYEAGLFKNLNSGEDSELYERIKMKHGIKSLRTINSVLYFASFCQNSRNFKNKNIKQENVQVVY